MEIHWPALMNDRAEGAGGVRRGTCAHLGTLGSETKQERQEAPKNGRRVFPKQGFVLTFYTKQINSTATARIPP